MGGFEGGEQGPGAVEGKGGFPTRAFVGGEIHFGRIQDGRVGKDPLDGGAVGSGEGGGSAGRGAVVGHDDIAGPGLELAEGVGEVDPSVVEDQMEIARRIDRDGEFGAPDDRGGAATADLDIVGIVPVEERQPACLLYKSDAADEKRGEATGERRNIKKNKNSDCRIEV